MYGCAGFRLSIERRDFVFQEGFKLLDTFIAKGHDPIIIVSAVHPDDAVLGLETEGQFMNEIFADAEILSDTLDDIDVVHLMRCTIRPNGQTPI